MIPATGICFIAGQLSLMSVSYNGRHQICEIKLAIPVQHSQMQAVMNYTTM